MRGNVLISGFYSDILFMPFLYSSLGMKEEWLSVQNVDRRADLSKEEFIREYEAKNRPVLITDLTLTLTLIGGQE